MGDKLNKKNSSEKFNPSNYRPLLPPGGARPRIMEDFISNGGRFNISIILSIDHRSKWERGTKNVKFSFLLPILKTNPWHVKLVAGSAACYNGSFLKRDKPHCASSKNKGITHLFFWSYFHIFTQNWLICVLIWLKSAATKTTDTSFTVNKTLMIILKALYLTEHTVKTCFSLQGYCICPPRPHQGAGDIEEADSSQGDNVDSQSMIWHESYHW